MEIEPPPIPPPPPEPEPPENWEGIVGLLISLAAFATDGMLSPVSFAICLHAMRRPPKTLAFTGFMLSIVGMALLWQALQRK